MIVKSSRQSVLGVLSEKAQTLRTMI